MKHSLNNALFAIILINAVYSPIYGMFLRQIRGKSIFNPRTFSLGKTGRNTLDEKRTLALTPPSQQTKAPPTLPKQSFYASLSQIPNRVQQWWKQWWSGKTHQVRQKVVGKTVDDIIEEIKNDPSKAFDNFDDFIMKYSGNDIDYVLDRLTIFGEQNKDNEIEFLESIITKYALFSPIDTHILIEKIVNWASENVIALLCKSTSTHTLVVYLMSLDSSKKLASEIVEKYDIINKTKAGSAFIRSLEQNPPKDITDTQKASKNILKKITEPLREKWKNTLSDIEKKYPIFASLGLRKKSPEQWNKEITEALRELRQRINDKKSLTKPKSDTPTISNQTIIE